jgi:hypothetical protein
MRIAGVLAHSLDAAEYSKRCRRSHAFTQDRGKRKGFMSRRVCVSEGTSLRGVALFKIHNDLARMGYSKSAVRAAPPFSRH